MCEKHPEHNEKAEKEDEMAKFKEKLLKLLKEDPDIRMVLESFYKEKIAIMSANLNGNDIASHNKKLTESDDRINAPLNDCENLKKECDKKDQEIQKIQHAQKELEIKLEDAEKGRAEECVKAKEQSNTIENLIKEKERIEKDKESLTLSLDDVRKEYDILKGRAISEDLAVLLKHIRLDEELTSRFELPADPGVSDPDLLLAAVAVLAQSNNFRRLWELYKDRCMKNKGPLEDDDLKVLRTVLGWLNANWPSKPYAMYSPEPGETYDYEKHMRPPGDNTGDKIQAVWLPGITELKLKPLMATR